MNFFHLLFPCANSFFGSSPAPTPHKLLLLLLLLLLFIKFSTGIFPAEKYLIPRPQTSSTFVRICADPRSADFCIVLIIVVVVVVLLIIIIIVIINGPSLMSLRQNGFRNLAKMAFWSHSVQEDRKEPSDPSWPRFCCLLCFFQKNLPKKFFFLEIVLFQMY